MIREGLGCLVLTVLIMLSGCGGGSSPAPAPLTPTSPARPTRAEAFQFLEQATFGPTESEINDVISLGFEGWINKQIEYPSSLQLPYLESLERPNNLRQLQDERVGIWFRNAIQEPDQLRQRVAFSLSEIMVVSEIGALRDATYSLADYYDMLSRNAFGNFRDLIEDVTLHPAMGVYLSMLGNEKPNPKKNIRPDENYAREMMQLFTIGLVQLNIDGTEKLDSEGKPLPTFDQEIVESFAHVYTGWNYADATSFGKAKRDDDNQIKAMQLYSSKHDQGPKTLLNGATLPADQSGTQDLNSALDNVFQHSNVGPFIVKQLIQRLVTSNPSPAYVARIAAIFNDNGQGVRGDLGAVVKKILLDVEARPSSETNASGKLKEPLLRVTQLWRAYNAETSNDDYRFYYCYSGGSCANSLSAREPYIVFGQGPLQSPSVFNFFSPFYAPSGTIQNSEFVAPEFQIATEYQNTHLTNFFFSQIFLLNSQTPGLKNRDVYINIDEEILLAGNTTALINKVADKLLAGNISDTLTSQVGALLEQIPASNAEERAATVIYLIASSPEFAR